MKTVQLAVSLLCISNLYLHRRVFLLETMNESSMMKTNIVSETNERKFDKYIQQDKTNKEFYEEHTEIQKEKELEQHEVEYSGAKTHYDAVERSVLDERSTRKYGERNVGANMESTNRKRNAKTDESSSPTSASGDNEYSVTSMPSSSLPTQPPVVSIRPSTEYSSRPSQPPVVSVRPSTEYSNQSPGIPTVSLPPPSSSMPLVPSSSDVDDSSPAGNSVTDEAPIESNDEPVASNPSPGNDNNNFILQSLGQIVASIMDSLFGDLLFENPVTDIVTETLPEDITETVTETVGEIVPDTDNLDSLEIGMDLPDVDIVTDIVPGTDNLDLPDVESVTEVLPDTDELEPDIGINNNPLVQGLQKIITFIMNALFNNDEDESEPSASPSYQSVTSADIDSSSSDSAGSDDFIDDFIDDFLLDDDSSKSQDSSMSDDDDSSSSAVNFNETEIAYLMSRDEELEREAIEYLAQYGLAADTSFVSLSDSSFTKTSLVGETCNCIYGSETFDDAHVPWSHGKIAQIVLNHYASVIRYINITYADGTSFSHGKKYSFGNDHNINLGESEHIVRVSGQASSAFIRQITFSTNYGIIYGPFGGSGDSSFNFYFGEKVLLYIFGRSNSTYSLHALGFASISLSSTPGPTHVPSSQPTFSFEPSISVQPSTSPSFSSQPSYPTQITRTGTVGGTGGNPFDHKHYPFEYGKIKQIELYWDSNLPYIRYIGIKYEKGQLFEQGIKDGDQYQIITLNEEQYIVAVRGRSSESINQITFETNDGITYGPYGNFEGEEFTFDFGGDFLVYIFGRSGWWINQLGFAYIPLSISTSPSSSEGVIRTPTVGSTTLGTEFDDVHSLWEYGQITQIELYDDYYYVFFIGITYETGDFYGHGGKSFGNSHIITFDEGQYITKVTAGTDNIYIRGIKFETNDGEVYGPYGDISSFTTSEFDFGGNVLVYIFGRSSDFLYQLGFAHAEQDSSTPSSLPSSKPSMLKPDPLIKVDFSEEGTCPSLNCSLHGGAQVLTAPGGRQALRIDKDGKYATIPDIDIGPSNMPDCTLTVGLYLESIPEGALGWVFGHSKYGEDRSIILHDPQFSENNKNGVIASGTGQAWNPWNNNNLETGTAPTKQWFHVAAVFRQDGECAVYVNGKKSDNISIGNNIDAYPDLYIGRSRLWENHWADAWIKEVKVFDEALGDAQIQFESDNFIEVSSMPSLMPSLIPSSQPSVVPSLQPSKQPSSKPSTSPSTMPSLLPSLSPSSLPSLVPSVQPSKQPSSKPSSSPSSMPSVMPSLSPSSLPSLMPSVQPSKQPSNKPSISPSSKPSMIKPDPLIKVDFSEEGTCPSSTCSLHGGAQVLTAPGGRQALRIDKDGKYATIPDIDIGPSNMPDCTLTVGLYLESIPEGALGWVFGHSKYGEDRSIILHDPQFSENNKNGVIASGTGQAWNPWASDNLETGTAPTKQWFHVAAVFRQGGGCAVYVNGVKSDYITIGKNIDAYPDLYIGRSRLWENHWADAWIKEVKVFDEALGDAQIQYESDNFIEVSSMPSLMPSLISSSQPSLMPSVQPSKQPSSKPSTSPSTMPSLLPSLSPSSLPSLVPSVQPSKQPSSNPSTSPSSTPSLLPSLSPSSQPLVILSVQPSKQPSNKPSTSPSSMPSLMPSLSPSSQPSLMPSVQPSEQPSSNPSISPSSTPSLLPSLSPSSHPSVIPSVLSSKQPSSGPSVPPSSMPSLIHSLSPSSQLSVVPSLQASKQPSKQPSSKPSISPSSRPSSIPSFSPSSQPSLVPSLQPSKQPSSKPSFSPSAMPSLFPSIYPSSQPFKILSAQPSIHPSSLPSFSPSSKPSLFPSSNPTSEPSDMPSIFPSKYPSNIPSALPSLRPSSSPSLLYSKIPSIFPTILPSDIPSFVPSKIPSVYPSTFPSLQPSNSPSIDPTVFHSDQPSLLPSKSPSAFPSTLPSDQPSVFPSKFPSSFPSLIPSNQPSVLPSKSPSSFPFTFPSVQPSSVPSKSQSFHPTFLFSDQPSAAPSESLTVVPSILPSMSPSISISSSPSSYPTEPFDDDGTRMIDDALDESEIPVDNIEEIETYPFETSCTLVRTEILICEDDPTFTCSVFASQGWCSDNEYKEMMTDKCKKSCNKCPPPLISDFPQKKIQSNSNDFITNFNLDLSINTDANSFETSWLFLSNNNENIIFDSNEMDTKSELFANTLHELKYSCTVSYIEEKQMDLNTIEPFCYSLEVHDSFGDGLCCDNGPGYISMSIINTKNEILEISNPFYEGSKIEISFCINDKGNIESNTETIDVNEDQPSYYPLKTIQCKNKNTCVCDSKPNIFTDVEKSDAMYEIKSQTLIGVTMSSQSNKFQNVESPQYKAACWVLFDDPYMYVSATPKEVTQKRILQQYRTVTSMYVEEGAQKRVMQRYALAVLYFSTTPKKWGKQYKFLSRLSECEWNKGSNEDGVFSIQGSVCDDDGNIISVYLKNNYLGGTIIEELSELKMLEVLDLSHNNIQGSIPSVLGQLSKLRGLYLSQNKLDGSIPDTIGNLRQLSSLELNENDLSGYIPDTIYSLMNLQSFNSSFNELSSSISSLLGNLKKLKLLDLSDNILSGEISSRVGELSSLQELRLSDNMLSGSIPSTVEELTSLSELALDNNQLTGRIPESLFNISSLRNLKLQNNYITGSIPEQLCDIDDLDFQADCQNDIFEPQVSCSCCSVCIDKTPKWYGECADATIQIEIDRRPIIHDDYLYSSDGLEWSFINDATKKRIPFSERDGFGGGSACVAFSDCISIDMISPPIFDTYFHIYWNNGEADIRKFPGSLELDKTSEYKNDPFQFDEENGDLTPCRELELTCGEGNSKKQLKFDPGSSVHISFSKATSLFGRKSILDSSSDQSKAFCWVLQNKNSSDELDLSDIEITQRYVLTILHFSSTHNLFGEDEYPPSSHECEWPGIQCKLNNGTNIVTGISLSTKNNPIFNATLIKELGGLQFLETLELNRTQLSGTIPKTFSNLWSLTKLDLSQNELTGRLPENMFHQLNKLEYIDISDNKIIGRVNGDIGSFSRISSLNLSKNQLTGSFPLHGFKWYDLEYLNISGNFLNSVELDHLIKHTKLKTLDLSTNFFVGTLHEDIFTSLSKLEYFDVSQNDFTGTIPLTFPELSNMTHFDMHANRLQGVIPVGITDMSYIQYINLQGNKLAGSLPSEINKLSNLKTLVLSHNEIKGTIPFDPKSVKNLDKLLLHGNSLEGKAPEFSSMTSYITDCGFPSDALDPISCSTCNTCCNADGNCQEKDSKELSLVQLTMIFVCSIIGFLMICYMLKYYITHNNYLETFFCGTVGLWNAMQLISDKSVYHFLLGKNKFLWLVALVCVAFQGATFFLFVRSADIANETSDREYTMTCPANSLDCDDSHEVSTYGFFVFGLILTIWLLKDIVGSSKLILVSFQQRNIDFFFAGASVFTVTMLSLWSSIVYIIAIAVKNTDLIKDAVILLFVIEIDERIYELVENMNPEWVDDVETNMRDGFVYAGNDLIISSFVVIVSRSLKSCRRKISESFQRVVRKLSRRRRDSDIVISSEEVGVAAPESLPLKENN